MADLIERLRECCTDSQGREMKDFAEPWGCEVALLREAATELEALRKRCEAVEAQHATLVWIMRAAEAAKEECGMDPESPAAIRNSRLASISQAAAQALGIVRGPAIAAAQEPSHG